MAYIEPRRAFEEGPVHIGLAGPQQHPPHVRLLGVLEHERHAHPDVPARLGACRRRAPRAGADRAVASEGSQRDASLQTSRLLEVPRPLTVGVLRRREKNGAVAVYA